DDDLNHLVEYIRQIKDTKFRLRLERAISDFYIWQACKDQMIGTRDAEEVFNHLNTTVRRVEHLVENRYGVHFKDTNEWGLYSFFVFDDGRVSYYYYRSDSTFQEERILDVSGGLAEHYRNQLEVHRVSSGL